MSYKLRKDLDFLFDLISHFFDLERSNEIISRLAIISQDENEISGWETWLQIEFYLYLMTRTDNVRDVVREYSYELDNRSSYVKRTQKNFCRVDIEICKKNAKSEKWLPLEIKQNQYARACIKNMLEDCDKYDAIKPTEKKRGDFRYPFFLGIFKTLEQSKLTQIMCEYNIDPKFSKIQEIKGTAFSFILF